MIFCTSITAQERKNALAMQMHMLPPSTAACSGCHRDCGVFYQDREFWIYCESCDDMQSVYFSLNSIERLVN